MSGHDDMSLAEARHILELNDVFTAADVEVRFRRAARSVHPDRGGNPESFRRLVDARARAHDAVSQVQRRRMPSNLTERPFPIVIVNTDTWLERRWKEFRAYLSKRPPRNLD